jgi:ferredoxin
MMKVTFKQETEGEKGKTILEVARDNQIKMKAPCEKGKCGKCKVRVLAGELTVLTKEEKKELSKKEIADGVRLACMAEVIGDVTVEIVKKKKK